MELRQHRLVLGSAAVAAATTLAVTLLPAVRFAYREPGLHIALETTAALVGLLVAFLAFGRFQRARTARDLVLAAALGSLAVTNLIFGALPGAIAAVLSATTVWSAVFGQLIGSLLFVTAAFLPLRRVSRHRAAVALGGVAGAVVVALPIVVGLVADALPVVDQPPAGDPTRPSFDAPALMLAVQFVGAGAFALAAVGFARVAHHDDLMRWLAAGAVLAAFARFHYMLYPTRFSEWVYTGDAFRLAFYVVLLVGAAREIRSYWRGLAGLAIVGERRRIARDLHDGAAQELAFIVRRLRRVAGDDEALAPVVSSAQRALADARHAIEALSRPPGEPLDVALARAAEDVAARSGVEVRLDLAPGIVVEPAVGETLVRIASEAVANAAHHSGATAVAVELAGDAPVRMCVRDDGRGFDPTRVQPTPYSGFGLVSMRERAAAIGAAFAIRSRPGEGTSVEVVV